MSQYTAGSDQNPEVQHRPRTFGEFQIPGAEQTQNPNRYSYDFARREAQEAINSAHQNPRTLRESVRMTPAEQHEQYENQMMVAGIEDIGAKLEQLRRDATQNHLFSDELAADQPAPGQVIEGPWRNPGDEYDVAA